MALILGLTEYLLIIVAVIFFAIQYLKPKGKKYKNVPPGPPSLPFIGNVHQLTNRPQFKMAEWAEKYGPIYQLNLGGTKAVVLNDVKLAKEVLFDTNFTLRPETQLFELFSGGNHGIIFTNGSQWEEQRRWVLRKLRDYGFGKTSMEGIIMDEANEVVDYFRKHQGSPITIKERFNVAVLNSIWTILNGKRMSQDDPKILEVLRAFHAITPAIAESGLAFAPWLKHVFPGSYKTVVKAADAVVSYARAAVTHHIDTHKDGEIRDFIDEYIEEIKSTTDPKSSFYKEFGRNNLIGVVSDLVQAGAETSSNTLNWVICYLSHNPDKQRKIHEELDAVLGTRPVTIADKPNLPYTEAVIWETLRKSSLVAGGVQHAAAEDKEVHGVMVEKGSWILTNIYYIHHDPKTWGDPENFRPERFLTPDGKMTAKDKLPYLIPFQLGRRQCLGESLARDTLFLFTASILQKFDITKVEKEEPMPENGLFLVPEIYHFNFKLREGQQ